MPGKRINRRTIYIGDDLNTMLENGSVGGANPSSRINRMAARYATFVQELAPQRWTDGDWQAVITAMQGMTINQPFDAMVLGIRLKQNAKLKGADSAVSTLAYRVENLRLSELLAVVDIAERAIAAGATGREVLRAWLQENLAGIT